MNVSDLVKRVTARFPDAQQIDDTVVRFTRRAASRPYAICYLDCTTDIPKTPEALRAYQDRIIGQRYFDGPTSLQWNHYLYFVGTTKQLTNSDAGRVRDLLEQNRAFARKFLISEDEIDRVLDPPVVGPSEDTETTSVLSIWNNRLAEVGLGRVIWGDLDMPRRLSLIEAQEPKSVGAKSEPERSDGIAPGYSLASLDLTRYRSYPLQPHFEFGTVNLVFGPNATGKTSLLEAIELFYCGRNKRSPGVKPRYDLRAVLSNGDEERVTGNRRLKDLRERNLQWYGQPEVLTNNLYTSFARFNFLDTDAAVHLADVASNIDDELSKLLIGPDASKTWESMTRVHDAAKLRLKDLQLAEKEIEQRIRDLDALLQQTANVGSGSALVRSRLVNMMRQMNWRASADDGTGLATQLVGPLSELVSLAGQASKMPVASTAVSRSVLARFSKSVAASRTRAIVEIDALVVAERQSNTAAAAVERAREGRDIATRIARLVAARLPERVAERDSLREQIAATSNVLTGLDPDPLTAVASSRTQNTVIAYFTLATAARVGAESNLQSARVEQNRLQAIRERSENLAGELRDIAIQFLKNTGDESECPLCHAEYAPGELLAHITKDINSEVDRTYSDLLLRLRELEEAHQAAVTDEAIATVFVAFCTRSGLDTGSTLHQVAAAISKAREGLSASERQLGVVDRDLSELEHQGLMWTDLEPARTALVRRRFSLRDITQSGVAALISDIDQLLEAQTLGLAAATKEADARKQQLAEIFGRNVANSQDARLALSELDQIGASAESLSAKFTEFNLALRIPMTKPLGELAVEAEAIRQVALELQAVLVQEEEAKTIRAQSSTKRKELELNLRELRSRMKKFAAAAAVLQRLQRDHPLNAAMKAAIDENRSAIESIFGQIHAPHEFSGLGKEVTTLVRVDGSDAKLSEISTGQRAALGLSMFLAQNMKLRSAPPVILIDDPIAHVDDLNCLAFLDYLREVAITRRRQIFFATANDKLASMFERKFDFLGSQDFRKIELHREA